ncbi:hypothetical protein BJY01DRAFT_251748 [Aspergillus pseudoustus]|uniref:Xaa-Pro dipeptidyl-peptidase-like domain-containing protein n=1 Tax=Aspergillus pseudoustus TaxID=1810923 RepID=A0ABR4J9Y3_9EURO
MHANTPEKHFPALVNFSLYGKTTPATFIVAGVGLAWVSGYEKFEGADPWNTGKIATFGASWLAITQWFVAALNPPHLTAIVPWDGCSDYYRDNILCGGYPNVGISQSIATAAVGGTVTPPSETRALITSTLHLRSMRSSSKLSFSTAACCNAVQPRESTAGWLASTL